MQICTEAEKMFEVTQENRIVGTVVMRLSGEGLGFLAIKSWVRITFLSDERKR